MGNSESNSIIKIDDYLKKRKIFEKLDNLRQRVMTYRIERANLLLEYSQNERWQRGISFTTDVFLNNKEKGDFNLVIGYNRLIPIDEINRKRNFRRAYLAGWKLDDKLLQKHPSIKSKASISDHGRIL